MTPHCTQKKNAEIFFFVRGPTLHQKFCTSKLKTRTTASCASPVLLQPPASCPCPSLETDENLQNLIGTMILHAWDDKDRQGWFEGRVHGLNLNARDLARAPTANFSVGYRKSLTVGVKKKEIIPLRHVAHEFTSRTYGEKKWWVVIAKDQ